MPDYKPLFKNVAQDPLVGELGNNLHHLFVYTGEQSNIDLKDFAAETNSIYNKQSIQ